MKTLNHNFRRSLLLVMIVTTLSCKKEEAFLNAKSNQSLTVPASLADLQGLLDNEQVMNRSADPALGQISSDDQNVQDEALVLLTQQLERNTYTWLPSIFDATVLQVSDWNGPYQMVYYANIVLGALPGLTNATNQRQADQIRGAALFYRSFAFYNLVQTFALPYDANHANEVLGIPLRLTADLNDRPQRSTLAQCYQQIIADLKSAEGLVPVAPLYKTQPSKPAVNALLARIFLAMGNYNEALSESNKCLDLYSTLNDYNRLNTPSTIGIHTNYLEEDIYHSTMVNYSVLLNRRNTFVDPSFVALYDNNDLRKSKYFTILDGLAAFPRYVGSYDHKNLKYTGLATDEIYLIKAECLARAGDVTNAMATLNTLLVKRWKTSTFVPLTAMNQPEAMKKILLERRKELLYRGLRWTDLRRLNKDPQYAITLSRTVNGTTYTLPPNDSRYAMPIPEAEIVLGGIIQNQR